MKTLEDLQAIKEKLQGQMDLRNESHAATKSLSVWQPAVLRQAHVLL